MENINYKNNKLFIENIAFEALAKKYGTPLYVYSKKTLVDNYKKIADNLKNTDNLICFSIKTCSNINIIKILKEQGAGCDIVSGGELFRALQAGVAPEKIVYAGVGKTAEEMEYALKSKILMFNCESESEIELLDKIAGKLKTKARVAVRVNPDVDANTHAKITTGKKENKFGVDINTVLALYKKMKKMKNIEIYGVHCHIGSQITEVNPFEKAIDKILKLIEEIQKAGISIKTLNLGGGLGIQYAPGKKPIDIKKYGKMVESKLKNKNLKLILEPGRYIAGNAGTLLTKIMYIKKTGLKNFAITDSAMNDLIRPTLYEAYHHILPLQKTAKKVKYDIVGPICESGDYFAKNRIIGEVKGNSYLAVLSAGAYGFSMASNYNSRPRAAEILVNGNKSALIRKRESFQDLTKYELNISCK